MSDTPPNQSRVFDSRGRGSRVLLAEPVEDVAYTMELVLEKMLGYQVVAFETTEDLLAAFMPGRDKWIFCETTTPLLRLGLLNAIRAIDATIPFFFHSAYGSEETVLRAKAAGANGWIEKPWNVQQLANSLSRFDQQAMCGDPPEFLWLPWQGPGARK